MLKHIRIGKKLKTPSGKKYKGFKFKFKFVYLLLLPLIYGCGGGNIVKTADGFKWKSFNRSKIEYKDDEVHIKVDNTGKPLFNLGDLPKDIDFSK